MTLWIILLCNETIMTYFLKIPNLGPLSWVWNHLCIIGSTMKTFVSIEFEGCSIAIKNSINWLKLRYINNQKINKGGSVKWFFYGWIFENWWKLLNFVPKNIWGGGGWGGEVSITTFGNRNLKKKKNLWNVNIFFH
jgi:hypothetical protein